MIPSTNSNSSFNHGNSASFNQDGLAANGNKGSSNNEAGNRMPNQQHLFPVQHEHPRSKSRLHTSQGSIPQIVQFKNVENPESYIAKKQRLDQTKEFLHSRSKENDHKDGIEKEKMLIKDYYDLQQNHFHHFQN